MLRISSIIFVFVTFAVLCLDVGAKSAHKPSQLKYRAQFSAAQDLSDSINESHFKLKNTGVSPAVVYGLYVRQFAYVAEGESCTNATVMYSSADNVAAGAIVMPVTIAANSEAAVGENYLYNMIYNSIYYLRIITPTNPPGCALPGCTWGADTTVYNWCIYAGAISPISATEDYSTSVVPASDNPSQLGLYNYDLISSYDYIGPISCNDETLTCSVGTTQTQSF